MRLYSYVVRYDFGFAPNPFHGYCTLATCKPQIRKTASVGDWVIGTGSADYNLSGRLVYAMKVTEVLSFDDYWDDERFRAKRPTTTGSLVQAVGDNIYYRSTNGRWQQEVSRHREPTGGINAKHMKKDLSGQNVLVSTEFVYWGKSAIAIPKRFRNWSGHNICQGRGYKYKFPNDMTSAFIKWLYSKQLKGCLGEPPVFNKLVVRRRC